MTRLAFLALFVLAACAVPLPAGAHDGPPPGDPEYLGADLDLLLQWFPGRFDNNSQVLDEEEMELEEPLERLHSIFHPLDLPAFEGHVFYVEQYMDGDPANIYRQRLYQWTANKEENAIQLSIFRLPDEKAAVGAHEDPSKLAGLTPQDLRPTPAGCEVFWRRVDDHFVGYMKEKACQIVSRRGPNAGKKFYIVDDLYLDDDEIWIWDRAYWVDDDSHLFGADRPHKLKKAHEYACWVALAKDPDNPPGPDEEGGWHFFPGVTLHDQGGAYAVVPPGEEEAKWEVELSQLTFKSARRYVDILKLGVRAPGAERDHRYIWAAPDSKNIGMNLRWLQVGCTKR